MELVVVAAAAAVVVVVVVIAAGGVVTVVVPAFDVAVVGDLAIVVDAGGVGGEVVDVVVVLLLLLPLLLLVAKTESPEHITALLALPSLPLCCHSPVLFFFLSLSLSLFVHTTSECILKTVFFFPLDSGTTNTLNSLNITIRTMLLAPTKKYLLSRSPS